ncbi:uncharacterized protein CG1161 [Phlebotomus argentipes]|uniref:uncharacterized protein CG1161 n=1 Tax=Phlebotomus argentipes TaxID=94469 RepID=UPI0028932610|nr:uncharacterized protein CG1161 [Phlebotomus argentipes]
MWLKVFSIALVAFLIVGVEAQSYEDKRCKCICPSVSSVLNNTDDTNRMLIIDNVPPTKCNCDGVILPRIGDKIKGKEQEFCPRCECKNEIRNTTIIKVVVIIVIWIISLLSCYMLFLSCLDPLLNKRVKANYQEHTNEDEESTSTPSSSSHPMGVRSTNMLNRVGHQQDKWKRQVREQRRNIYDRHTMLN